jgi:sialate O-acetylesterase
MRAMTKLIAFVLVAIVSVSARAELKLPAVISDHMVLQRGKPVTIWGWADAEAPVEVTIEKQTRKTKAEKDGTWRVEFKSLKAGGPLTLTVRSGEKAIDVQDVLIGEVWVCSGQSNMQMTVSQSLNGDQEVAAANFPSIRLFDVPRQAKPEPQQDVAAKWAPCSPETVKSFSGVGYFFGRDLHKELNVPIGLIGSNYGGTPAEAWTSRQALEAQPSLKPLLAKWDAQYAAWNPDKAKADYDQKLAAWQAAVEKAKADGGKTPAKPVPPTDPKFQPWSPGGLYNAMIAPLTPYTIAGAIWYQGESNVQRAYQYRTIFSTMIRDWRDKFDQPKLPFYFVQIAPYEYGPRAQATTACPELWEAQLLTLKNVPHTGMAVINDVGDIKDIHPKNKQAVGHRLALWALANTYDRSDLTFSGPIYKKAQFKKDKAVISFEYVGQGLASRDGQPLTHFTIAGEDQQFHPATATIEGKMVVVRSDAVAKPVAVRFAWTDSAEPNLINHAELPASPFRTDDWKGVTEGVD